LHMQEILIKRREIFGGHLNMPRRGVSGIEPAQR
jgi:hypothetical protein